MPAPTVTWSHVNQSKYDDQDVSWVEVNLGNGTLPKLWGGWAEPTDQYGYYASHYSCTPTSPSGHQSDAVSLVGSYLEYNTGNGDWVLMLGFTMPGNGMFRAHVWTAV